VIGAPWLDGQRLAAELTARGTPGVSFVPIEFTPTSSKFAKEKCGGVNILITDRAKFEPLRTGFEVAAALRKLYPDQWETKSYDRLLSNEKTLQALRDGQPAEELDSVSREGVPEFLRRRARVLLYD
jgi:uncharacterized protein YbbC (DUF1343 family)